MYKAKNTSLYFRTPLVSLDMGGAVAWIEWAPYSSSVFSAITDEGVILIYDLHLRKCRPLCKQDLSKGRKIYMSCMKFSRHHPIVLVTGTR